jgi:hypothetical protein
LTPSHSRLAPLLLDRRLVHGLLGRRHISTTATLQRVFNHSLHAIKSKHQHDDDVVVVVVVDDDDDDDDDVDDDDDDDDDNDVADVDDSVDDYGVMMMITFAFFIFFRHKRHVQKKVASCSHYWVSLQYQRRRLLTPVLAEIVVANKPIQHHRSRTIEHFENFEAAKGCHSNTFEQNRLIL